jgi:hypothetical protein
MSAATVPVQQATIRQYAKQLQLTTIGGQFVQLAEQAVKEKQGHLSYLEARLGAEVEDRYRNAVARRIKDAASVSPISGSIVVADTFNNFASIFPEFCTDNISTGCSGDTSGAGSATYAWRSADSSVAKISGLAVFSSVNVTGVGVGSTTIRGIVTSGSCFRSGISTAKVQAPVPTALSNVIGSQILHNSDAAGICPGTACIPVCYGYERRVTYTVLDQDSHAITNASMTATEAVTKVSSNPSNAGGNVNITVAVGSDGTFGDILAYCVSSPPPPQPGEFIKDIQAISVMLNAVSYPVRTNCLDFESNDVSLTDVTKKTPPATCQ